MIAEETRDLLRRAQAGDTAAAEQMVTENAGLIWSVARRFFGRGVEPDDLYQLGCVGFLKAMQGFDEQYGTCFSTYAVPKISGEIRRFLRDDGAVKVSRSIKERGKLVEQKEIRLISPNYACSGVETLSLPAEVASAFAMNWDTVVFDVGGDAVGSTALGRYYEDFQDFMAMGPEQLEVLNVVNIRRPLAGTVEKIIDLQQQMEIHSHLKITGMINNTNLATMTTPAELRDGYEMLREVSDRTGVPVMYTTGKKEMLDIFLAEGHDPKYIGKPVPIDIIMKRDWDSYIHSLSEKKQA